jgi:hypothetical protein
VHFLNGLVADGKLPIIAVKPALVEQVLQFVE